MLINPFYWTRKATLKITTYRVSPKSLVTLQRPQITISFLDSWLVHQHWKTNKFSLTTDWRRSSLNVSHKSGFSQPYIFCLGGWSRVRLRTSLMNELASGYEEQKVKEAVKAKFDTKRHEGLLLAISFFVVRRTGINYTYLLNWLFCQRIQPYSVDVWCLCCGLNLAIALEITLNQFLACLQ